MKLPFVKPFSNCSIPILYVFDNYARRKTEMLEFAVKHNGVVNLKNDKVVIDNHPYYFKVVRNFEDTKMQLLMGQFQIVVFDPKSLFSGDIINFLQTRTRYYIDRK